MITTTNNTGTSSKTTVTDAFRTCITLLLPLLANAFTRVGVSTSKEHLTSCLSSLKRNTETCVKTVKSFQLPKVLSEANIVSAATETVVDDTSRAFQLDAMLTTTQHFSFSSTPIMLWWEDVLSFFSDYNACISNPPVLDAFIRSQRKESTLPASSMPSQQKQIPVLERITKAMHEECGPWVLSLILPVYFSLISQSTVPMLCSAIPELVFFGFICAKLMFLFDKPKKPQPLLDTRSWENVVDNVWASQTTLEDKRDFIMGWFYDHSFEDLRREDALTYLAWMRYGNLPDRLTSEERDNLEKLDLHRLEQEVNYGKPLPSRANEEGPLPTMRFTLEQIRFRHKPLLFYALTHGANSLLITALLKNLDFDYFPAKDSKHGMGYWHRKAQSSAGDSSSSSSPSAPLIFAHGVGGLSFYYKLVEDICSGTTGDVILLDLPFVSLRINDDVPKVTDQVVSVCQILDETVGRNSKATFVGHSYGTTILSWMAQACPERVANAVFLDPICFQLHLKDILFKFHFQRADLKLHEKSNSDGGNNNVVNPFSLDGLTNLAGSELHTNMAMFRHFPWATIELWPHDLHKHGISTSVILSEHDEIVPSREVEQLFADYNAKRSNNNVGTNTDWAEFLAGGKTDLTSSSTFVKAEVCKGAVHGTVIFDDEVRAHAVSTIHEMISLNTSYCSTSNVRDSSSLFQNLAPAFWPSLLSRDNDDSVAVATASSVAAARIATEVVVSSR
eukprot:CAMPEP_0196803504 /NCGR_PEP_ID=MMETSP1362-20130617/2928_1 /TAXON_ID=163516 /ORGANISM="Leptocylindrus danicus, Strain CCMP1856" /LENGTH=731 /DNA_ID=CAMNT_0042175145 /DNA_START=41 /DNA_END=2236 /DNA_ORIENTATION=+